MYKINYEHLEHLKFSDKNITSINKLWQCNDGQQPVNSK